MKRKLFVVLLIVAFSVSAAMAGHHGMKGKGAPMAPDAPRANCGPGMGRDFQGAGKLLQLADKLELTDKQIAEIKGQMEKNGLDRIDRQADLKKAELKLRHLQMNDASDNEILAAIDKVGDLKTDLKKQQFIHRSEMKSILTETQQEKLKELRNERRGNCRTGGKGFRGQGMGYNFDDEAESDTYGMEPPSPPPTPTGDWEY
jgi:Spy/CpxP family protein refolding chaperone